MGEAKAMKRENERKRLIIVYNPRSSKFLRVEQEVLTPARKLKGWMVGKYEVAPTTVEENAGKLAEIIKDGDVVISAGGDGTAAITFNGLVLSGKKAKLGVLPYGNFNDFARCCGGLDFKGILEAAEKDEVEDFYGLEVKLDRRHFRFVACYLTVGMFAESTKIFDGDKVRKKLRKGRVGLVFSLLNLAGWYFRNLGRRFLAKFRIDGQEGRGKTTDLIFLNAPRMARLMKGRRFYRGREFLVSSGRLLRIDRLMMFMLKSMTVGVPGELSERVVVEFLEDMKMTLQAEGEFYELEEVRELEVTRMERAVKVVMKT